MPPTQRGRAPAYPEFFGLLPTPNQFDLEQQNWYGRSMLLGGQPCPQSQNFDPRTLPFKVT